MGAWAQTMTIIAALLAFLVAFMTWQMQWLNRMLDARFRVVDERFDGMERLIDHRPGRPRREGRLGGGRARREG